jgi:hypothetical protein
MEGTGRLTIGGWMETADAAAERMTIRLGDGWPGPMTTAAGWRSSPSGWDGSSAANDRRWRTPGTAIEDDTAADVKDDGQTIAARVGDDSPDERSGSGVRTNAGRLSPLAGHTSADHRLRRPARPAW